MAVAVCLTGLISPSAQAGVSFGLFYDNLSPYGSWQVSARYGRVWQPAEETEGWNPYYDGHWVYTDVGWTWISDYEWGAIPYHYGTWTLDPAFGWVWVPGTVWAPAWVVFRTGPDYIGWAPVAPGFSVGVSFRSGRSSAVPFTFVPTGSFLSRRVRTCVVPQSRTTVVINNTRIVNNLVVENNVVVNRGPDLTVIEKASGRRVHAMPIERVSRVTPGPHFTRDELRVDPQQLKHGLRVAEPVSAKTPLPTTRSREAAGRESLAAHPGTAEPSAGVSHTPQRVSKPSGKAPEELAPRAGSGDSRAEGRGAPDRPPVMQRPTPAQPRRMPSAETTAARQPSRQEAPGRAPAAPVPAKRNEPPARGEKPAPKEVKRPHDSGKDKN